MKSDYTCAEIIDDSETDEDIIILPKIKKTKTSKPKIPQEILKKCYNEDEKVFEIGVDEVGRGPLFGRVYTAAVILPKDNSFDCSMVKDSKKYHSKKKLKKPQNILKNMR
jgi:ribonuclease HII